ncbi:cupin domain-containing protein [Flavihumibacter stibioxidans]|uniref:Cupin type-2 domain-containing protein n=1 Tax=Flavihumibacter stibioxidans TaxID=1834163 RepID=A0ABR7MBT0_9BACT|nr:cupin domain-containing protein [Flavihumibacter stibioxidans]MBC6492484.1 hypothetical protein [Flavihumibacter stibioxidans]
MQETSIRNLLTGQEIKFLSGPAFAGGDKLWMEMAFNGIGEPPPMHFHPLQEERFTVLSGYLVVRFSDQVVEYRAGDVIEIPRNTPHGMWNGYDGRTVVNWEVFPAMRAEVFFKEVFEMVNDRYSQQLNDLGFLQKIVLANKYSSEFRLVKPPMWLVKLLYGVMWPVIWFSQAVNKYKKPRYGAFM